MKRKICVVTGSRAEYGVMHNVLKHINESEDLELLLVVTGAHLSKDFGHTIDEIRQDGFSVAGTVELPLSLEGPTAMGRSMGSGIIGLVDCLKGLEPDLLLITADRYEIFAACAAAMAINLPIAHISGGEVTEGAIDEQIRHAITKMSHIHFTAIEENTRRVIQMGEEPWRVHEVGGPWIDNIKNLKKISKETIKEDLGVDLSHPTILVTYHPVTLQIADTQQHVKNLLGALDGLDAEIVFTYPNADSGSRIIVSAIEEFIKKHPKAKAFKSLGKDRYLNMLSYVDLMVGNSSSGLTETQAFKLPVVNIGDRQGGKPITENIICTAEEKDSILAGIKKGLSEEFRKSIADMKNPYDRGDVAENIVKVLSSVELGPKLLKKKFILL